MNILLTIVNDLKKQLLPLLDRNPYRILYSPYAGEKEPECCIVPTAEHLRWQERRHHRHYSREILFVVSGACLTFAGNHFFDCPAGTLQLFSGNEIHNSFYFPGAEGIHIWAKLQNTRMTCFVHEIKSSFPEVKYTISGSCSYNDKTVIRKLNDAWDELPQGSPETIVELEALFRIMFCSIYRNFDTAADLQHEMMINIRNMLTDNCGRDMDIAYLARLAGFSKQHFMRKFKEVNGCTVGDVIETARLKELEEIPPGMRIKELADQLGFDSPSSFCHWRKKHKR